MQQSIHNWPQKIQQETSREWEGEPQLNSSWWADKQQVRTREEGLENMASHAQPAQTGEIIKTDRQQEGQGTTRTTKENRLTHHTQTFAFLKGGSTKRKICLTYSGWVISWYFNIHQYVSEWDITQDNIVCIHIAQYVFKITIHICFSHCILTYTHFCSISLTLWPQTVLLHSTLTQWQMDCGTEEELVSKQKRNGSVIWR